MAGGQVGGSNHGYLLQDCGQRLANQDTWRPEACKMGKAGLTRVCVIGATGFIGKRAAAILAQHGGFAVRATHRSTSTLPDELSQAETVVCDVSDLASISAAVVGCEVVVNCAGIYRWWVPDNSLYNQVNCDGAKNVAEACSAAGCVESSTWSRSRPQWLTATARRCHSMRTLRPAARNRVHAQQVPGRYSNL